MPTDRRTIENQRKGEIVLENVELKFIDSVLEKYDSGQNAHKRRTSPIDKEDNGRRITKNEINE